MSARSGSYVYSSLTSAISDIRSPLRAYLDGRFPNRRAIQSVYREKSGPLLVPGGVAHPGTLGAAFDFGARFVLNPSYVPRVAIEAFRGSRRRFRALVKVIEQAQVAAGCRNGPAPDALFRASWALALSTEVYRTGSMSRSPLRSLGWLGFSERRLMALAPHDALIQMQQLHLIATNQLFPHLPRSTRRLVLGPTFDASRWCSADADLISEGELIELKTRLGRPSRATGVRSDSFPAEDIYQMLAYALFDWSDRYAIDRLGMYSARYGSFVRWTLEEYTRTLAGGSVDLARERGKVRSLLLG